MKWKILKIGFFLTPVLGFSEGRRTASRPENHSREPPEAPGCIGWTPSRCKTLAVEDAGMVSNFPDWEAIQTSDAGNVEQIAVGPASTF